MSKKLFRVKYVNQSSGEDVEGYFFADGLEKLDEIISDILEIYPIPYEELPQRQQRHPYIRAGSECPKCGKGVNGVNPYDYGGTWRR